MDAHTALAIGGWVLSGGLAIYAVNVKSKVHRSRLDPVTGLNGRHGFEVAARRLLNRENETTGLMMDLDGLKAINDQYGHAEGTRHIQSAALALTEYLPAGAAIGRVGGDEFVAVWPGSPTRADLEALQRRIRCSVGVAAYTVNRVELSDLIGSADSLMYEVKRAGGDDFKVQRNLQSPVEGSPRRWKRNGSASNGSIGV